MSVIPVNVWLPDASMPCHAGDLDVQRTVSTFTYGDVYKTDVGLSLAPGMPVRAAPHKITGYYPIFPIMLDSGPDDWGTTLLERKMAREVTPLEALLYGPADGAGNIVLGELTDDRFTTMSVAEFQQTMAELEPGDDAASLRRRERVLQTLLPGTSLGGAKPKLTLVKDGVQYVAKFPERADDPFLPHLECGMLTLAKRCGIDACDAEVVDVGQGRYALLAKRFDRVATAGGTARIAYVSAWSVSRLDQIRPQRGDERLLATAGFTPDMYKKSYVYFADSLPKWCRDQDTLRTTLRELWRRIVFNSLIRNSDDHPRNHGLICDDMASQRWRLSPAFDMVTHRYAAEIPGHAMAFLHDKRTRHNKLATDRLVYASCRDDLLLAATLHYGYDRQEAAQYLDESEAMVRGQWREVLRQTGMPDDVISQYQYALDRPLPRSAF